MAGKLKEFTDRYEEKLAASPYGNLRHHHENRLCIMYEVERDSDARRTAVSRQREGLTVPSSPR